MKKYLIALVMIVMIMSCFFGKTLVMANEESDDTVYNRYYTTIEVEKGDTLWSIAKTYYHHSGMSVREYVYELKLINGMVSDEIRAGNMISVEYYAENRESVYKVILKKMFPDMSYYGKNRFHQRIRSHGQIYVPGSYSL